MRICCDFGDPASYLAQTQVGGEVSGDSGHSHYVSVQPLAAFFFISSVRERSLLARQAVVRLNIFLRI